MAKRSLASMWAKSFERSLTAWTRESLRQGSKPRPARSDWLEWLGGTLATLNLCGKAIEILLVG